MDSGPTPDSADHLVWGFLFGTVFVVDYMMVQPPRSGIATATPSKATIAQLAEHCQALVAPRR